MLEKRLAIRMEESDLEKLKKMAIERGLKVSSYARMLIFQKMKEGSK